MIAAWTPAGSRDALPVDEPTRALLALRAKWHASLRHAADAMSDAALLLDVLRALDVAMGRVFGVDGNKDSITVLSQAARAGNAVKSRQKPEDEAA